MKKIKNLRDTSAKKVISEDSPFAIREAFNLLRTNLMYTTAGADGAPVFAVTSATESAGKSTVLANLAISFAQINKKVLLIDGDMRCPVIHSFFGLDYNDGGLSEIISGINENSVTKDVKENLDVITSGRIPPNPSELITSPRFAEHIEQWRKEYDIIFIDFPPIGIVTDAIANCQNITGYIFVIRSGKNTAKSVKTAINSMEQVGAKIAGIVLNDYNIKGTSKYNYGNSNYSKSTVSKYESASKGNGGDQSK